MPNAASFLSIMLALAGAQVEVAEANSELAVGLVATSVVFRCTGFTIISRALAQVGISMLVYSIVQLY